MRFQLFSSRFLVFALILTAPASHVFAKSDSERIAELERRLLELEQQLVGGESPAAEKPAVPSSKPERLGAPVSEQKAAAPSVVTVPAPKPVEAPAAPQEMAQRSIQSAPSTSTLDVLSGSAWRDLRWTRPEQWDGIKKGLKAEQVVELLGYPPRSLDSLKPRIDKVYWYETSIRDRSSHMRGKISFRKGRVVSFEKPDFDRMKAPLDEGVSGGRTRLP